LLLFFDAGGFVFGAEDAAGIIALFLGRADLAIEPAEEVHELGETCEVSFRVLAAVEFLEHDLGEASGGGLKTDFGEFRSIVTAEEIQQLILVETVFDDVFMDQAPFGEAADGPVGDVFFANSVAGFAEGAGDILIGNAVVEHAVNHIALDCRERGNKAAATEFSRMGGKGQGLGVNEGGGLLGREGRSDEDERRWDVSDGRIANARGQLRAWVRFCENGRSGSGAAVGGGGLRV
jgi:hypothetical protein